MFKKKNQTWYIVYKNSIVNILEGLLFEIKWMF